MVLQIVLIDLVLSVDNAAVIGMAICRLPHKQRRQAAAFGALLAIALRTVFALTAAILLDIPYLSAIGAVILLFITYKLLFSRHGDENIAVVQSHSRLWHAVGVIVAADASMAFDNVLGVAGAAAGKPILVCFGLLLSVPILVCGASFAAGLMNKYPILLFLGAAVLTHTAVSMLLCDEALRLYAILPVSAEIIAWSLAAAVLLGAYLQIIAKRE